MRAINIATFTDRISDRQLEQLCADNPETKFETAAVEKLIIMAPTGRESGKKNSKRLIRIGTWNEQLIFLLSKSIL